MERLHEYLMAREGSCNQSEIIWLLICIDTVTRLNWELMIIVSRQRNERSLFRIGERATRKEEKEKGVKKSGEKKKERKEMDGGGLEGEEEGWKGEDENGN